MRSSLRFAKWMSGAVKGGAAVALFSAVACAPKQEVKPQPAVRTVAAPVRAEASTDELYQGAQSRLAQGDYAGAQAGLDATLARDPNNVEALFASGWLAEKQGRVDVAAADYKKALAVQPDHKGAALNLARLDRASGHIGEGEQVLRAALLKNDGDPQLLTALAGFLRLDRKLDEAEATIRRVLARSPDSADAYKTLALIELDRNKPRLAEASLLTARKLDTRDPGISNNLGLIAMNRGEIVLAREKFTEALKLDGSYAPAWANLGALALSYRDYPAAADAYSKATALDPNRWDEQLAYAWSLEGLKKPADAQAAFEKVLALKPGQDDALYGKATALKAQNRLPEAMAAFQSYAQLPSATHAKDAQSQIAQIDLRLKNPPKRAPALEAKHDSKGAGSDISALALPAGAAGAPTDAPPTGSALPPEDGKPAIPPATGAPVTQLK